MIPSFRVAGSGLSHSEISWDAKEQAWQCRVQGTAPTDIKLCPSVALTYTERRPGYAESSIDGRVIIPLKPGEPKLRSLLCGYLMHLVAWLRMLLMNLVGP